MLKQKECYFGDDEAIQFQIEINLNDQVEWLIKKGDNVKQNQKIIRIGQKEIKSPIYGKILKISSNEELISQNQLIFIMQPCLHEMSFNDLCVFCFEKVQDKKQNKENALIQDKSLKILIGSETSKKIDNDFTSKLLNQKQLVLILDLDNTLLHAMGVLNNFNNEELINVKDIIEFPANSNNKFIVKLRPYLMHFFKTLQKKFVFYIYTMGNRGYAENICYHVNNMLELDPETQNLQIYQHQIISRDDNTEYGNDLKNVKRVIPVNEHMILILDDKPEVWKHDNKNLVYTKPYYFWDEQNNNIRKKYDNYLYYVTQTLCAIHTQFYENQSQKDVRQIYSRIRYSLFENINIIFSGIFQDPQIPLQDNKLYKIAKQYGANILEDFDENYNDQLYLITNQYRPTKKMKLAKQKKIPILHDSWISFSIMYGQLIDIQLFDLLKNMSDSFEKSDSIDKLLQNLNDSLI